MIFPKADPIFKRQFGAWEKCGLSPGPENPIGARAMPAWHDSFSLPVIFQPIPRKKAAAIWNKARRLDMKTSRKGRHGGMIGRSALAVLSVLIFDFLDYASGRLDPSQAAIARKARMCERTVATALQKLRTLGILHWLRRCHEE